MWQCLFPWVSQISQNFRDWQSLTAKNSYCWQRDTKFQWQGMTFLGLRAALPNTLQMKGAKWICDSLWVTTSTPTFSGSKVFSCLSGKLAELVYYIHEEREEEPWCKDWLQCPKASYFSLFVLEFQVDFIFVHSSFSHPNLASIAAGIVLTRLQDKLVLGHLHPEDNKTKL